MANILLQLVQNKMFLICLFIWLVSQLLKFFIYYLKTNRLHFGLFYQVTWGGMPSSHSAIVAALSTMVYLEEGVSIPFLITLALAIFVIYDALIIRWHMGSQAKIINSMLSGKKKLRAKQLEEIIGHDPSEVIAGLLLGLVMALLFY